MQNGAYGARAMHSLESYSKGKPTYDGNAYKITTTYQNGHLLIHTTYPTRGEDGIFPEYYMTHVRAFALECQSLRTAKCIHLSCHVKGPF
jgi:hypothetical protein